MNISSAIVNLRPGHIGSACERLASIGGVEIHAVSEDGRLVVSIESTDERDTADIFESIQRLEGVLAVSLVYSHCESDPDGELSGGEPERDATN